MTARPTRRAVMAGTAATAAVGLTGCLQNPDTSSGSAGGEKYGQQYAAGTTKGNGTVTILGAFGGDEQKAFEDSMAEFSKSSGITIQYSPDQDFTTTIQQRVSSGDAPDIALFPQPGGLFDLARKGVITPIDVYLDFDKLTSTLIPGFLDSGRMNGRVYGAPMRLACKSLIWYPKALYDKGGWAEQPKTMQELYKIGDSIRSDLKITPWSDAWGASQATGWVGTDWVEEFMLRVHGPETYDDWTSHRIPFNDKKVVEVFDILGDLLKKDGNVLGGVKTIINTPFAEAVLPLFKKDPTAMFVRQGNFITGFFPPDVLKNIDTEVGVMAMPTWDGGYEGQPILGGGDLAALFNLNDDTVKVMQFLSSDEFGAPWAKIGGWLSPHKTFDPSLYADETTRRVAKIAADAKVFRYDGSDLMPNAVGGGSFWTNMVEWLQGTKTSQQACDAIEASWPK